VGLRRRLPWIGPFPTAGAARAAPCGGDPSAAARRRLAEWARAEAGLGPEPPAEADWAGATIGAPPAGDRRGRVDPACAATAEQVAGSTRGEALAPTAPCTPARARGPSPRQRGRVAVGGPGLGSSEGAPPPPAASSAPRQLAFGFGQGAGAAVEHGGETRPTGRKRLSKRGERPPAVQGALPF
jgi:hypothetical protein